MKEKFIEGIHNYCDRWCERCDFTSRCRVFENPGKLSTENLDLNNKAFWQNISLNFQEAINLLHKAAEEQGIDLNTVLTPAEQTEYEERQSFLRTSIKQHLLIICCKKYQSIARPFVQKSEGFTDRTRELVSHLHLGINSEEEVVYTVADIGKCFEIIQWYLFFIDAKLQRALHGKMARDEWKAGSGFQKDSDGSAKIALVAIERSMGAWTGLYNLLPSSEDTAINALAMLQKLQQTIIEEFPDAMTFKRPGFDD